MFGKAKRRDARRDHVATKNGMHSTRARRFVWHFRIFVW